MDFADTKFGTRICEAKRTPVGNEIERKLDEEGYSTVERVHKA